jgi:hypothetical protein
VLDEGASEDNGIVARGCHAAAIPVGNGESNGTGDPIFEFRATFEDDVIACCCLVRASIRGNDRAILKRASCFQTLGVHLSRASRSIFRHDQPSGVECVHVRNLDMAVGLLIENEKARRTLHSVYGAIRLGHDVELADLGEALEHLNGLHLVRDLERVRRRDAAAAEGARGEALDARLEVGDGGRASLLVPA